MTESGWRRSGVTPVGGGEERVMVGARGVGGEEGGEVEVGVGGSVGGSHEMEDGGSPAHSCISLMNSQSMS